MNAQPTPRPWWVIHWYFWLAPVLALVSIGGGGWYWVTRADAQPRQRAVAVERGDLEDLVTATGLVQPRQYVDVGAQVSGQLKKLYVDVGSEVKAGQLLAEIDAEQSTARVEANQASLRAQRAALGQSQAALAKAERDLQRERNLWASDATTAENVQNAETAVTSAKAQIETLKAQIDQAEASTRVEEANLKFAKIFAPMAGTVISVDVRQGQTLNATQQTPTVLRIADLTVMTVQAEVSEADVGRLRPGLPVYFTTLGNSSKRWLSTLRKIEPTPTVTNNVVLYNALFDVPNADHALMSQMTAQVYFVVSRASNVLKAPTAALTLSDAHAGTVKVLMADGGIQTREVQIGVSNRVQAEIVSGLLEGEKVLLPNPNAGMNVGGAKTKTAAPPMPPGGFGGR